MKNKTGLLVTFFFLGTIILGFSHKQLNRSEEPAQMNSFISIFEIPATDLPRAAAFYESILDIKIEVIDMQGTEMGLFPSEGQSVSGVITKGEGYEPSDKGVLVYLNGGDNLNGILNKVENSGGKIVLQKTMIDEENGYFALFMDTEGNRMGIHSPN